MNEHIGYGNPYYLLLALTIMCYASFTMMSMVDHIKPKDSKKSLNWMIGASLVFSLGAWTMHVVSLLASDFMLALDWSMIGTLASCVLLTFAGLYFLIRAPSAYRLREGMATILISIAATLLPFMSLFSNAVQSYSIDNFWLLLSFVISLTGTYMSILLFKRKLPYNRMIASIVLGVSNLALHLLSMHSVTIEYRDIMTIEMVNDYMFMLALVIGMSTLMIISFSHTTWFNTKKLAVIDERYKLLVENSMDTIALIKDGKWEYLNPSGLRLFEARHESELIGRSVCDLLEERSHSKIAKWMEAEKSMHPESMKPIELVWRSLSGKLIHTELVRVRANLYGSEVEQVIIRDISERKKNEELLIKSEKLSIAGQLAAGIAHEIRNPLTSLKGFMQLLASGRVHHDRYYSIMQAELVHIETIISELLMLSKPQAYEYDYIDIRQLMKETMGSLFQIARQHNVKMVYVNEVGDHPLWVMGVEPQLRQVFLNILKNAIESMQHGGNVKIQAFLEEEKTVGIRIQDEGTGIPQEQLSKMGQPFYTTKEKGTGLGLMVTYKIVDHHEGNISAESEVGIGTTFTVRLPHRCPADTKIKFLKSQTV